MQPLMYRHRVGNGGVVYLALGHSAREFDKPKASGPSQATLRAPWDLPVYKELVRRGVEWASKRREPSWCPGRVGRRISPGARAHEHLVGSRRSGAYLYFRNVPSWGERTLPLGSK
jgi:hypothetical protein